MKRFVMRVRYLLPAVLALSGFALQPGNALAEKIINARQPELAWETTLEGVAFAPLQGNRFEQSYMAMVRLPAGLVSPVHVKSAAMYGVVVSGEMVHSPAEEKASEERVLGAGDFYKIPAGLPHLSKCVSEIDCITFLYQDGPFDFLPVEGAEK